ncbi:hypothetical protein K432DRAFT_473620, partial [Lepidopterella palustris CBS 459.81]
FYPQGSPIQSSHRSPALQRRLPPLLLHQRLRSLLPSIALVSSSSSTPSAPLILPRALRASTRSFDECLQTRPLPLPT